jgi:PadR family transcriptional regulator
MKETLGDLEQLVLLALIQLGDGAYGAAVQREIDSRTSRAVTLGAVYSTLARLEAKGFVTARIGDPTPVRGGRRKKVYAVEPAGRDAMLEALSALRALSRGIWPALEIP